MNACKLRKKDEEFVLDHNEVNHDAMYQFTHKNGRKVIALNWAHFFHLQSSRDYIDYRMLGRMDERLGIINAPYNYEVEKRVNKFWFGALGHEKTGEIKCSVITYNALRIFLKHIHNHACMQGDKETVNSTNAMDKQWWHNGTAYKYQLPNSTNY